MYHKECHRSRQDILPKEHLSPDDVPYVHDSYIVIPRNDDSSGMD